MASYNKVTPADFRSKLKNGGYDSLTGARRAVGKMKDWEEKEKDSARTLAEKHFGVEIAAKPAKPAKGPKKVAKKTKPATAKKAATAVAPEETPKKQYGPGRGRAPKVAKTAKAKAPKEAKAKAPKAAKATRAEVSSAAHIESTTRAISSLFEATNILQSCSAKAGVDVTKGLEKIAETATRLVEELDRTIVAPLSHVDRRSTELFAQAAPIASPGNGASPPVVPPQVQVPQGFPQVVPPTYQG